VGTAEDWRGFAVRLSFVSPILVESACAYECNGDTAAGQPSQLRVEAFLRVA
jgi:hypothetical protein